MRLFRGDFSGLEQEILLLLCASKKLYNTVIRLELELFKTTTKL